MIIISYIVSLLLALSAGVTSIIMMFSEPDGDVFTVLGLKEIWIMLGISALLLVIGVLTDKR